MNQSDFDYLGPYRVEGTLGRGGMGTVYKGVHAKNGEIVAIKVIATGVANQSRFRRRFEAEIETLQRLKHPNIVGLRGVGEEQGLLFYAMEYVNGHSLHEHLRQHSRLPWEDVVEVAIQTTAALKHAHDLGIIHRDLKPANLMLNKEGQLKLTDFGIAKLFGSTDMTAAGSVIGTADYMPPEQAEGKPVTVKSDLYSLGGVMYALLCGKAPFSGKTVPEVLYAVRYNPVPRLEERVPDVPVSVCELVHHLLEKSQSNRPPTALVVGNRLKSIQQGLLKSGKSSVSKPTDKTSDDKAAPGTQLTSLDLSDVEDDELKLTNEGHTNTAGHLTGLSNEKQSDTPVDEVPASDIGTHEQQTMLAPGARGPEARARGPEARAPGSSGENDSDKDSGLDANGTGAGFAAGDYVATELAKEDDDAMDAELSVAPELEARPFGTNDSPLSSGGPSHYTPITEDSARPFSLADEQVHKTASVDWLQHASIAGIVALLIGSIGFIWWMVQPRAADEIYQEIMLAVDSGDDGSLLSAKDDIEEFLSRFPQDERAIEIEMLSDDMELTRWTRILKRRAAREGGENELTAIEQGFLDCMDARGRDAALAQEKLQAFLQVYGPLEDLSKNEQRLVELASFAAASGDQIEQKQVQASKQLQTLIAEAEQSMEGETLESYYRDLILLYESKPWAAEQVARIREKLELEQ